MGDKAQEADIAIFDPLGPNDVISLEVMNQICNSVANGNYISVASAKAGVEPEKVYGWISKGKLGKPGYKEFYLRLQEAQADHESRLVDYWSEHFPKDYRAIKDFMARRYPDRWGEKTTVEHVGEGGGPVKIDVSSFTEEELDSMRETIKKIGSKIQ